MYELGDLASKLISPLLKDQLNSWSPLQNPQEPMALIKQWKDILDDGQPQTLTNISTQDPYHNLIWNAWMPSVRTAVTCVTSLVII
jgi:tuftelin-interacting protein 11